MAGIIQRPHPTWLVSAALSSLMLVGALLLPLWRLELVAPQYPAGLVMHAYGYKFADDAGSYYDDVREINGLNHYIGMKRIEEVTEMKLFVPGVIALIIGTFAAGFVRWQGKWLRRLIVAGYWFMPLFFVADLQYWLYNYGHTMNEDAALNTGAFTPKVFGTTKVWNFHSQTSFEAGTYLMVLAALTMTAGPAIFALLPRLTSRLRHRVPVASKRTAGAGVTAVLVAIGAAVAGGVVVMTGNSETAAAGQPLTLQQRIDAAAPEDIIIVDGGVYRERLRIDKPVSFIGRNWPVIDGDGQGDVVTITADDVFLSGFEIRGSGRALSQEPAAIKIAGAERVKVSGNRVRASHVAVHVTDSAATVIRGNDLRAGTGVPEERRGHGIYFWQVSNSTILENTVRDAADGIHLEFSDDNLIVRNTVTQSRYALHFMYAHRNRIVSNVVTENLSGAVLMFSHDLILKDNDLSSNRDGATGAGLLLKDTDNFYAEGNRLLRNRYGMTAEGAPQSAGATAIFRRNLFALNDVGVALTSNSPITFVENAVIDNAVPIKSLSGTGSLTGHGGASPSGAESLDELPSGAVWASNGRGNYWSDYRGYDEDGDGVGDQPYRPRPAFAGALADSDTLRAFQFTLAQQAIDLAADMFPVYRYEAVIEDPSPLMSPPSGTGIRESERFNRDLMLASATLVALAGGTLLLASPRSAQRKWLHAAARFGFAAGKIGE